MQDVRIRDARPPEAARLAALMREWFLAAYRHCSSADNVEAFLAAAYGESQQRAELEDGTIASVVAEDGDAWLGLAQLRFGRAAPEGVFFTNGAEVGRLYLAPQAQGRGLGSRLLRELERRARARGCDGLWLNAWQEAPQALAFYRREGFAVVGTTTFVVGNDAKLDWRMAKALA